MERTSCYSEIWKIGFSLNSIPLYSCLEWPFFLLLLFSIFGFLGRRHSVSNWNVFFHDVERNLCKNGSPVTLGTQTLCPALGTHEVRAWRCIILCVLYTNYIKVKSNWEIISVRLSLYLSPSHFNRVPLNSVLLYPCQMFYIELSFGLFRVIRLGMAQRSYSFIKLAYKSL